MNADIGDMGLSAIRRSGWEADAYVTLGQAGPSRNQNPFWSLLLRNWEAKRIANGDPPEEVNYLPLAVTRELLSGTRGTSEYTLRERLSSYPLSYALFNALPMKVTLGRFIRAVKAVGGLMRTVHIGTRLEIEDATLLRLACESNATLVRLDFAIEVPCLPAGLEVYCRPQGWHPGAAVTWYDTFDGENAMWKWTRGNKEASELHMAKCAELLTSNDESVGASTMAAGWASGRRPLRAQVDLTRHKTKLKEMEYFALHHHIAPLLPSGVGSVKQPALSHVVAGNQKATDILSHLCEQMPSLVAAGGLRIRHENVYSYLSRSSLGLPNELSGPEFFEALITFCRNDCLTMHLHRHSINAIAHAQFHNPYSVLMHASFACDSLHAMTNELLAHSIGSHRVGLNTSLARLGLPTEIALLAQLARVHQRLFCYREIDRDAIELELRLKTFLQQQLSSSSSSSTPQGMGADTCVYTFVCSLTVECMRYCLGLIGKLTTGKRDALVDRLSSALLTGGERTLQSFASILSSPEGDVHSWFDDLDNLTADSAERDVWDDIFADISGM